MIDFIVIVLFFFFFSNNAHSSELNKAELSQSAQHMDAPNIWMLWKISRVLTTPTATFPEICNGLLFRSILRMCVQNLKFVALPVPEIILWGTEKNSAVPRYAHAPFSPKFLKGFWSDWPCECRGQIWSSYSFSRSWDNSDCSFGVGLRTPNLGEEEAVGGQGWYRSKERLRLPIGSPISIATFPLSVRVSEILPLLCSSTPLFPTPPLVSPKISPCSLGSRWMAFGLRRTKVLG